MQHCPSRQGRGGLSVLKLYPMAPLPPWDRVPPPCRRLCVDAVVTADSPSPSECLTTPAGSNMSGIYPRQWADRKKQVMRGDGVASVQWLSCSCDVRFRWMDENSNPSMRSQSTSGIYLSLCLCFGSSWDNQNWVPTRTYFCMGSPGTEIYLRPKPKWLRATIQGDAIQRESPRGANIRLLACCLSITSPQPPLPRITPHFSLHFASEPGKPALILLLPLSLSDTTRRQSPQVQLSFTVIANLRAAHPYAFSRTGRIPVHAASLVLFKQHS